MICGRDCHPGDANCNNYCNAYNFKPIPDSPNDATPEMKLAYLKKVAHTARLEAEKAWYAYFCECELGEEREHASDVYDRIRTATRRSQ